MAMWSSSDFFKRSLNFMTSTIKRITICTTRPADSTRAWKTGGTVCKARSTKVSVAAPGSTTNGWTVKISSSTGAIAVTSSGVAKHVALMGSTAQLYYVTTCTSKALAGTDQVNWPKFNIRIANPTSS